MVNRVQACDGRRRALPWPIAQMATAASRSPSTPSSALTASSAKPSTRRVGRLQRRGHAEDVGQRGAGVPEGVAIGSGSVAEGVPPEGAGHDQRDRRLRKARLTAACGDERGAHIARAQLAQTVVLRGVVVDARGQVGEIAAHEVELEVVARARRARGAKFDDALANRRDVAAVAADRSTGAPPGPAWRGRAWARSCLRRDRCARVLRAPALGAGKVGRQRERRERRGRPCTRAARSTSPLPRWLVRTRAQRP